ncbi:MAG: Ig-like domain-containing protein [Conexivisphaerales archaeon]
MNKDKSYIVVASIFLLLGLTSNTFIAFAWHSSLTTNLSATTVIVGNVVYDTATLSVSNGGNAQPTGTITFAVYSGTCNSNNKPTGNLVTTLPPVTVAHAGSYQSAGWDTTGQAPGNYVFVVSYSGGNGYPPATAMCEKLTLVNGSSVPEFPLGSLGMAFLFALSVPMLYIVRKRALRQDWPI